jgi:hypothetical protein
LQILDFEEEWIEGEGGERGGKEGDWSRRDRRRGNGCLTTFTDPRGPNHSYFDFG